MEKIYHEIWKESFLVAAERISKNTLQSYLTEIGIDTAIDDLGLHLGYEDDEYFGYEDNLDIGHWPNAPKTAISINGRDFYNAAAIKLAKLIQKKHQYVCFDYYCDDVIQSILPEPTSSLEINWKIKQLALKFPRLNDLISDLKKEVFNESETFITDENIIDHVLYYQKQSLLAFFIYDERHRERRGNLEDFKDLLESRSDLLHVRDWAPNWLLKIQDDVFAPLPEWKPFENADKRK